MITFEQFRNGLIRFLDAEMISKISGWQKYAFGISLGIMARRTDFLFEQIKHNPIVSMLGIIDENNMIDIDTLYEATLDEVKKNGFIAIDTGNNLFGVVKLSEKDIEKLYKEIMKG